MTQAFDFFGQRPAFRQLVWPTISIGLVLALTVAVLKPQIQGLVGDFEAKEEAQERLQTLKTKVSVLASFDAAFLRTRTERLNQALPSSEDLGYFIGSVRQVAVTSGVIFAGVEVLGQPTRTVVDRGAPPTVRGRRVTVEKNEEAVQMLVNVIGDLESLGKFIKALQQSLPLTTVDDFTSVREGETFELTGRMTVTYHYAPPPKDIGSAEVILREITAQEEETYSAILGLTAPEFTALPQVPTGKTDFMSP